MGYFPSKSTLAVIKDSHTGEWWHAKLRLYYRVYGTMSDAQVLGDVTKRQIADYRRIVEDHIARNDVAKLSDPNYLRTLPGNGNPLFRKYVSIIHSLPPEALSDPAFRKDILDKFDQHILDQTVGRYSSGSRVAPPDMGGAAATSASEGALATVKTMFGGFVGQMLGSVGGMLGGLLSGLGNVFANVPFISDKLNMAADYMAAGFDSTKVEAQQKARDAWAASEISPFVYASSRGAVSYSFAFNDAERLVYYKTIEDSVAKGAAQGNGTGRTDSGTTPGGLGSPGFVPVFPGGPPPALGPFVGPVLPGR